MSRLRALLSATVAGATAAAVVAEALDGLGTRPGEGEVVLPGDELTGPEALVRTRAITVAAPPADLWPWLVQLGWGRGGWYAIDALERPLGAARSVADDGTESWRSLDEVADRHQDLAVGDTIPLNDRLGFEVVALRPQEHLVAVYDDGRLRMVWALVLVDHGEATRLVARTAFESYGTVGRVLDRVLDPGHAVMEVVQLRNLRRRAEGYLAAEATVR